jgi:glycosyltransferase A (GT-A) superfamily protein (DUF2064 family)
MARAPRRHEVRRALEEELGSDRCLALQATLLVQAAAWARALEPRAIHVAHDPVDSGPELRRLLGDDLVFFPQTGEGIVARLSDAVARVAAEDPGPILVVWPDLPALRHVHGEAAIHDLVNGADVVLGPVFDGGFYLIGLARPLPELFNVPEDVLRRPDGFNLLTAAAYKAKLEVGLLPAERALHRPADVRAVLSDPTFVGPVAKALGRTA